MIKKKKKPEEKNIGYKRNKKRVSEKKLIFVMKKRKVKVFPHHEKPNRESRKQYQKDKQSHFSSTFLSR